jgi:hypothetical protein
MICFVIQSTFLRRVGTVSKTSMRGIVMVIDPTSQTGSSRFRVARFLGVGLVAGFVGGVVARAWMRVVAKNPEFTWSGTLAITIGFMVFGVTQSGALAARQIATKPSTISVARVVGAIGMLPLFFAAGAQMLPTVIGGGLALARTEWPRRARIVAMMIASVPVVFVTRGFVHDFGWSLRSAAGVAGLLAIYGSIIWATRSTLRANPAGLCQTKRAKVIVTVVAAVAVLIPFVIGGIR